MIKPYNLTPILTSQAVRQLTRLHLTTADPVQAQSLAAQAAVLKSYDLVSITPRSERVLQQACSSLDVDIISLDLWQRLPFKLKPNVLQVGRLSGAARPAGVALPVICWFTAAHCICGDSFIRL